MTTPAKKRVSTTSPPRLLPLSQMARHLRVPVAWLRACRTWLARKLSPWTFDQLHWSSTEIMVLCAKIHDLTVSINQAQVDAVTLLRDVDRIIDDAIEEAHGRVIDDAIEEAHGRVIIPVLNNPVRVLGPPDCSTMQTRSYPIAEFRVEVRIPVMNAQNSSLCALATIAAMSRTLDEAIAGASKHLMQQETL